MCASSFALRLALHKARIEKRPSGGCFLLGDSRTRRIASIENALEGDYEELAHRQSYTRSLTNNGDGIHRPLLNCGAFALVICLHLHFV